MRPVPPVLPRARRHSLVELPKAFPFVNNRERLPGRPANYLHRHDCLELGWCSAGAGHILTPSGSLHCQGPCGVIIPAGCDHIPRGEDGQWTDWTWIHCDAVVLLGRALVDDEARLLAGPAVPVLVDPRRQPGLAAPLQALCELPVEDGNRSEARALLLLLLARLARLVPVGATAQAAEASAAVRIAPALRLLQEHWRENRPLSELAQACDCSPAQLRRNFVAATGMPPARYRTHLRIQFAAHGLRPRKGQARNSVEQAARSSGFRSVAVFSRQFRRLIGVTPRDWMAGRSVT